MIISVDLIELMSLVLMAILKTVKETRRIFMHSEYDQCQSLSNLVFSADDRFRRYSISSDVVMPTSIA